jgi:D-aminopeptidase
MRARDLGLRIGRLPAGPTDTIADVAGVRVGHATIVEGDGPLVVGRGPIRTGVTVIAAHDGDIWTEPVFAGAHRLNGNGELTGLEWIREAGMLSGAVGLTNTHSVGVVHDALIARSVRSQPPGADVWSLPVVGETWDGLLNDINGFHVRAEHVDRAFAALSDTVAEGNVGGGPGMTCHEFKGGIGTASRVATSPGEPDSAAWTVGALVQANYGTRESLRIDGVPVGEAIPVTDVPSPVTEVRTRSERAAGPDAGSGSIIVVLATDAPLLPHQCERLAQRAGLGIARMGGIGGHSSGDLFLAFATGNRGLRDPEPSESAGRTVDVRMVADNVITPLFQAAVEATEGAIVNALLAAETMTGRDGIIAHALPHDRLLEAMARYGRPAAVAATSGSDS